MTTNPSPDAVEEELDGLEDLAHDSSCKDETTEFLLSVASKLRAHIAAQAEANANLQAAYDDTKRLAREIDVAMHCEENAAKQASLCDLVKLAEVMRDKNTKLEAERDDYKETCERLQGQLVASSTLQAEIDALEASNKRLFVMLKEAMPIMMQMVNIIKKQNEATLAQTDGGGNG